MPNWQALLTNEYLLFGVAIGFGIIVSVAIYMIRKRETERWIHVLGVDPDFNSFEYREIKLDGRQAVWEVDTESKRDEDIRFVPKAEMVQTIVIDGKQEPAWMLDLSDGRTFKVNPSGDVIRTSGQELHLAVKDNTINQLVNYDEDIMAMLVKYVPIFAIIVLALLAFMVVMQFFG